MDLFVCQTAYQLLNAIAIVKMNNLDADVLLFDRRISNVCDVGVLENSGFFNKVFEYYDFLDKITDADSTTFLKKIKNTIKKIIIYPSSLKIVSSIPNANIFYNRIYISYLDIPTQSIFFYFNKQCGSKLSIYDDGTYTYDCLCEKQSFIKTALSKVAFKSSIFEYCDFLWARRPEMVDKGNNHVIQISKIDHEFSDHDLNEVFLIFKTTRKDVSPLLRKIIFFDQPYKNKLIQKKQLDLATSISKKYGRENVIVKIHPSYKESNYGTDVDIYSGKIPFELIISLFEIEKTILISIFSTACFTPKTMYGKEPPVMFVYKAISLKRDGRDFNEKMASKYIKNLKNIYLPNELVFVPSSTDEMFEIIDNILKNNL